MYTYWVLMSNATNKVKMAVDERPMDGRNVQVVAGAKWVELSDIDIPRRAATRYFVNSAETDLVALSPKNAARPRSGSDYAYKTRIDMINNVLWSRYDFISDFYEKSGNTSSTDREDAQAAMRITSYIYMSLAAQIYKLEREINPYQRRRNGPTAAQREAAVVHIENWFNPTQMRKVFYHIFHIYNTGAQTVKDHLDSAWAGAEDAGADYFGVSGGGEIKSFLVGADSEVSRLNPPDDLTDTLTDNSNYHIIGAFPSWVRSLATLATSVADKLDIL